MDGRAPLAIDLYAGLGGWTDGLLAEGWRVIGFDIEQHVYGEHRYPAQIVVQDVLTLDGAQFRDADLLVASPPCQFFSYTAMPWSRAKALAAEVRADPKRLAKELALFNACFRIQREACAAAGRHIPLVVENVRGAQPWVGRAQWNFGSYYLWGDVPALMPPIPSRIVHKAGIAHRPNGATNFHRESDNGARKNPGFRFDGSGGSFQTASVEQTGIKCGGDWFNNQQPSISRRTSSKSPARKFASAMIAKIPLTLSRHIAAVYHPRNRTTTPCLPQSNSATGLRTPRGATRSNFTEGISPEIAPVDGGIR